MPLSDLIQIWQNSQTLGTDSNDLLVDDTEYAIPHDVQETSDELGDNLEISSASNVKNYKDAINYVKDLQTFVQQRGDFTAMGMLSGLKIQFQDVMIKMKTSQTTLLNFFKAP